MGKYIIDVPDEGKYRLGQEYIFANDGERLVASCNLTDLTPYTEPDKEQIENEVWGFVRKIVVEMECSERYDCFGDDNEAFVIGAYSYKEVKEKYETWKKSKDEIRVGDEVEICGTIGIVTKVPYLDEERVHYIAKSGATYCNNAYAEIKKTGRHFDEIEELLKKMRGVE